jgi:hypothetical protein
MSGLTVTDLPGGVTHLAFRKQNKFPFFSLLILQVIAILAVVTSRFVESEVIEFCAYVLPLAAFIGTIAIKVFYNRATTSVESILVFPGLGVQIETTSGGKRFFNASEIDFFTINEGFERCRIVVYLVLVTVQKKCVVLFNDTRPDLKSLVVAFDVLDCWIANTKST